MDINLQIKGIKSQIEHMKFQVENIEAQNNNIVFDLNNKGDQLLNLSIQMLNTGLQAFYIGCNLSINKLKFYEQLNNISQQINNILTSNQMMVQNMMFQQQMMNQMMQQQIIEPEKPKINAVFVNKDTDRINYVIVVLQDITVKELFDKYMQRTGENVENSYFLVNGKDILRRNDTKRIIEYYPGIEALYLKVYKN